MIIVNIAADYTRTPGGRFASEGKYSGEDFREKVLKPKFLESLQDNEGLTVILDGGYGYATSFLEEAFGGLAREFMNEKLKEIIIISEEEPPLIAKVKQYIEDALKQR